jgi:hypothetical protein
VRRAVQTPDASNNILAPLSDVAQSDYRAWGSLKAANILKNLVYSETSILIPASPSHRGT